MLLQEGAPLASGLPDPLRLPEEDVLSLFLRDLTEDSKKIKCVSKVVNMTKHAHVGFKLASAQFAAF